MTRRRTTPVWRPILTIVILFLSAVAVGVGVRQYILTPPIVSPLPQSGLIATVNGKSQNTLFTKKKTPDGLKTRIIDTVGSQWRNYSVVVRDMASGLDMTINAAVIYTGASINKVAILAALYSMAAAGETDLDRVITLQETDIQDYGTGSIRYDKPGTTYSIKTLARLMMQQSDNTAAYILANHIIGVERIQKTIGEWGLAQTDMVNNKTSNADMATLMDRIWHDKVANHALSLEMLAFMQDSEFEDRIPAELPKGTPVSHKTGNGQGFVHDIGIVTGPKGPYYIGILVGDVIDEPATIKLMAKVSRAVYDYLQ